jgi:flagellar basal body-associated protein FliL
MGEGRGKRRKNILIILINAAVVSVIALFAYFVFSLSLCADGAGFFKPGECVQYIHTERERYL